MEKKAFNNILIIKGSTNCFENMEKTFENFRVGIAILCIMFIILGVGCLCCSIYCSITQSEYSSDETNSSQKITRSRLQTQKRYLKEEDQAPNKGIRSIGGSNKRSYQSRRISFAWIHFQTSIKCKYLLNILAQVWSITRCKLALYCSKMWLFRV